MDKPRNIEFKGATDLVTDTDKASEDAILSVRPSLCLCILVLTMYRTCGQLSDARFCAGAQRIIPRPRSTRRRRRHLG